LYHKTKEKRFNVWILGPDDDKLASEMLIIKGHRKSGKVWDKLTKLSCCHIQTSDNRAGQTSFRQGRRKGKRIPLKSGEFSNRGL